MPRLKPDITITWRDNRTGEKVYLELIAQPCGKRIWLRRDRKNSAKCHDTTLSDVFARLRKLTRQRLS